MSRPYAAFEVYYLAAGVKTFIPNAEVKIYDATDDALLDTVNADADGIVWPGAVAVADGTPIYYEYEEASVLYRGGQGVTSEFLYQDIVVAADIYQSSYPTGTVTPVALEVAVKDSDDAMGAWRVVGQFAPTAQPFIPLKFDGEKDFEFAVVAIAPDGTRSASEISHAPQTMVSYSQMIDTYATDFGDGSSTSFTITHGLGSQDLQVEFRYAAGTKESVSGIIWQPDATDPDNKIVLTTTVVPATNELRVIIKK